VRIDRRLGLLLILLSVGVYAGFITLVNPYLGSNLVRAIWLLSYALNVIGMIVYVFHQRPLAHPIPEGKIVCIVPAYNEDPVSLNSCIQSLLKQTVPIDRIYVIDDGSIPSAVELKNFEKTEEEIEASKDYRKQDVFGILLGGGASSGRSSLELDPDVYIRLPGLFGGFPEKVRLIHMKKNRGKRRAQAEILRSIDPEEYPFCLTVDSDSFLAPSALESMIREMFDPNVKACTATVLASNYSKNVLTKVQDFNYGISLSITRSSARAFGLLDTTSGACALYRTEIITHHVEDYLEHGKKHPYGDDRRMALYSLMEGHGKYVPEAIVYTEVPETMSTLWRQRVRWSQGVWSALPYFITNLGVNRSLFQVQSVTLSLIFPGAFAAMIVFSIMHSPIWILMYIMFVLLTTYSSGLFYTLSRFETLSVDNVFGPEGVSVQRYDSFYHRTMLKRRLKDWLIVSPLLVIFMHFVFLPCKYVALYRIITRNKSWGTR